ncbi:probable receptor-like protein kinase At2g23200 [Andrographis paniculata]|uniref:probable receptor-like protein kinase At2g23200 n=1 Tax=Andrographis paniculata TaxID=175694 RepID=UPI0021E7CF80|nr:probable receptor-like protein kinase At2g23200 [Andrographis paniculata]
MAASPLTSLSSYLALSFLLHLSLTSSASAYALPQRYFINCGSDSTVTVGSQNFTGDVHPANSLTAPSSRSSITAGDPNSSAPELYRTARIFTRASSYAFQIDDEGIYLVRFHFSPLSSFQKPFDYRFNVSVPGAPILSNFTVANRNFTSSPPIEEFLFKIAPGNFRVEFVPYGEDSFAFVNAIEVFIAPPELIPDNDVEIPSANRKLEGRSYADLRNATFLHVIHRINVGGGKITPEKDNLLRFWIPDDDVGFMINTNAAQKAPYYTGNLNFNSGSGSTEFIAPPEVYRTAKEMRITGEGLVTNFNVSWRFAVRSTGADHLLRLHFCDFIHQTDYEVVKFNLYIYNSFRDEIYPYSIRSSAASPFYLDYLVTSDASGFMNISIGPSTNSENQKSAYLNGVEIIELIDKTGLSPLEGSSRIRKALFVGLGIAGGISVLGFAIIAVYCCVIRKKKWTPVEAFEWPLIHFHGGGSSYTRTTVRTVSDSPTVDLNLGLRISFADILVATNKFDPKLIVGKGGFGKVYRGMLWNGMKVAVKRSQPEHGQGVLEFQTEIVVLSTIRHRHLVSLIGYCDERDEMILVYEFMEKGTLRDHLYASEDGGESESRLSWVDRLDVCVGAAKGLYYLHTGSKRAIIHRDIKSTNILLDEHNIAKVADFGLSHTGAPDESHVSTQVKGSFGYLDPEYFKFSQLTQKSDVYSFGVVLLETLCARPAVNPALPREQVNLADWGLSRIRQGQLDKIVDARLVGTINDGCLRKFGETVEKCLKECGADRPNMVDVLWDLEYCLRLQNMGTPPAAAGSYEYSTATDVAMGLAVPVLGRLASDTIGDDEVPEESGVLSELSQVDAKEVFSQLRLGEAR